MGYLFLMLGFPGSGKSYVSEWLGPKFGAVHLRSDDLRLKMFGPNRLELHTKPRYLLPVIRATEYMEAQVLKAGHSVINDANLNRRSVRRAHAELAEAYGALAVTVWVQAPLDIAERRVVARMEQGGHGFFEEDFVRNMAKKVQPPRNQEVAIILDGTAGIDQQQADFDRQFAIITANRVQ